MRLFFGGMQDMRKRTNGEGTIFKRKDGRWCGAYFDKSDCPKRHFVYGKTQKEVHDKLKRKQLEVELDSHTEYILTDWISSYLKNYKRNEVKVTTFGTYMETYRKHIEGSDLGKILITKLKPHDLQTFYNLKMEAGYNSKTVRHIEVIINSALKQALRERLISENPNDYTVLPKRKAYQGKVLTPEEVRIIVDNAKDEELYHDSDNSSFYRNA